MVSTSLVSNVVASLISHKRPFCASQTPLTILSHCSTINTLLEKATSLTTVLAMLVSSFKLLVMLLIEGSWAFLPCVLADSPLDVILHCVKYSSLLFLPYHPPPRPAIEVAIPDPSLTRLADDSIATTVQLSGTNMTPTAFCPLQAPLGP